MSSLSVDFEQEDFSEDRESPDMDLQASTIVSRTPGSVLLEYVDEPRKVEMFKMLIASLQTGDRSGIDLAASLVGEQSDKNLKQAFLTFLEKAIQDGHLEHAVAIGLQYPSLGTQLFEKATEFVGKAKFIAEARQHDDGALLTYLSFAKSIIPHLPFIESHSILFKACLGLVNAQSKEIQAASKDVIFAVFSMTNDSILDNVVLPLASSIWSCIVELVTFTTDKMQPLLGYSIWLRWLLCPARRKLQTNITDDYWQLLLQGLRRGGVEQRKICLNILKLTVEADSATVPNSVREQYLRYCTVFETIVLGRYINQIHECETDLNLLAANELLEPEWLYTLLASTLDSQMQDSNRKFIGNWVMGSNLKFTSELTKFLEADFLPWAIQGQLFVSTQKKENGELRCIHGDRLSQFVSRMLRDCPHPHQLTDIMVDTVLRRKDTIFAYAIVYLLDGLNGQVDDEQIKKLAVLNNMPEVARDFVRLRTRRSPHIMDKYVASRRDALEQDAIQRCSTFDPEDDNLEQVWDDLEYLEYPKALLMAAPSVIFHPKILWRAESSSSQVRKLAEKLEILRNIAETKVFLFPPLVTALRKVVATVPHAVELLQLESFIVRVTERPPEPTRELMLEETIIHLAPFTYKRYFGERPSYGFAVFLDIISRLQVNQDVVRRILKRLLDLWKNQKVPPLTVSPWKTTLQLQVILLCFEQLIPESTSQIRDLLDDLFHILAIEPLPRYRYLLEWIIVRLFLRYDLEAILTERLSTKDHHSNPKHLASLMKIGTILARVDGAEEPFALQLATLFVPLAASSKVVVRHEAQWQFPLLMDYARTMDWRCITENVAFSALDNYIRGLERFHEPPNERLLGIFDPAKDHTLTNLVEGSWFELDHTEAPLTRRAEFLKLYDADLELILPESCMPLGDATDRPMRQNHDIEDKPTSEDVGQRNAIETSALQTKGAAYLARALSDPSLHHSRANNIIVVGSLVENPYNLGGLSRVAEIFGASALCLQNQKVLSNKEFTSVSVSSHLHFPMVPLPISGIPTFLTERKSEGFSVVGLEQTDRSVVLGSKDAKLPEKVVLVVGSEREGIPAVVLTECDILAEIPQQGITRSLNVQTAVSIVLYEHARQHRSLDQGKADWLY